MFCKNCKKQIGDDERFCGHCGIKTIKKTSDGRIRHNTPIKNYNKQTNDEFSEKHTTARDHAGNSDITIGTIALIIGGVLTWITYEAASDGGTYFVFWGLMIYGGYKVLKGLTA